MQQFGFLLQDLLFAQHVSGTIMPIIRSSSFIQMVAACDTWPVNQSGKYHRQQPSV